MVIYHGRKTFNIKNESSVLTKMNNQLTHSKVPFFGKRAERTKFCFCNLFKCQYKFFGNGSILYFNERFHESPNIYNRSFSLVLNYVRTTYPIKGNYDNPTSVQQQFGLS